jgi:hypothetical protein
VEGVEDAEREAGAREWAMTAAPIVLAFTGTRRGLTPAQLAALRVVLAEIRFHNSVVHNGAAEGADEEMLDLLAEGLAGRPTVHLWPCNRERQQWAFEWALAFSKALHPSARVHPTAPPLERNRRMVAAASVVVACPDGPERLRSGTWSTVRAARRRGREVVLVWPDGSVTREEPRQ